MEMNASYEGAEVNETARDSFGLTPDERRLWDAYLAHEELCIGVVLLCYKCISPFGLLFNLVFLAVVVRVKSMRTIINVYLSNLAVADTIVLVCFTAAASRMWDKQSGSAYALRAATDSFQMVSCSFVTAVAVERFFAVREPLTFRARASKKRAAKISAGLWTVAVVVVVVVILSYGPIFDVKQTAIYCYIIFILLYVTTSVITICLYGYIILKLCRQTILDIERGTEQNSRRVLKVVRMLLINTTVFFLLNIMHVTYLTLISIGIGVNSPTFTAPQATAFFWASRDIRMGRSILCVVNSTLNPLVYSLTNEDYRKAVLKALLPLLVRIRRCLRRHRRRRRRHGRRHGRRHATNAVRPMYRAQIELLQTAPPGQAHK